eukprot:IDg628t1
MYYSILRAGSKAERFRKEQSSAFIACERAFRAARRHRRRRAF